MYISSIHQILLFWTCLLSLPNFIPPWHPLWYLKVLSPNSESSLKKCQPCPHQPCPQLLLHQKVSSRPWRECPSHPVLSIGLRSLGSRNSTSRISRSQQQHSICWTYLPRSNTTRYHRKHCNSGYCWEWRVRSHIHGSFYYPFLQLCSAGILQIQRNKDSSQKPHPKLIDENYVEALKNQRTRYA